MRNLFEKAVGFRSFIMNMNQDIRKSYMKYYIPMTIRVDHREVIGSLKSEVKILGVVEGACPDCQIILPMLEKLVSTSPYIDFRLVLRGDVKGELEAYKVDEKLRVPTFIFMNKDFEVLGAFVEKPDIVKQADTETVEGSETLMKYRCGKLVDETIAQMLKILTPLF